ncbi:glycosyl hydrolase family 28-related protein [Lysinibacillus sp. FSL K6-4013]|uniref:glycosyl hydrolase family 28-related protein n=1 Tax=Lysinibacillus sp. FSL K6-4013 TaxID=2921504 RepID=UPI00315AA2AC
MTILLNNTGNPINRDERNKINENWQRIIDGLTNLQMQIKVLAGGQEVDELIARLEKAIENAETDLQNYIEQINSTVQEAINANNTATQQAIDKNNAALQASLGEVSDKLQDLSTAITNAETATTDTTNAKNSAIQATQDAQNAISNMRSVIDNTVHRGEWNSETQYFKNNMAVYNGSTFISLQDNLNKVPPTLPTQSNVYWSLLAQKGDKGSKGEKGDTGAALSIQGKLTDASQLPPSGQAGHAYSVNGELYVWSENTDSWENVGNIKGEKGDTGNTGEDGLSAYEVAVNNGFVGTSEEWLASLKGEKGDKGQDADLTEVNQEIVNLQQTVTDNQQVVTQHLANMTLNVKNYGAVGDGVVDDTQAFVDALADLKIIRDTYRLINNFQSNTGGNITLYVPHGTYKISNQLNIPKGTCIRGENHCSVIFTNLSFTMFSVKDDIAERLENGALLDEDIYTIIENISLFGCKYGTNPFAAHTQNNSSNGIVLDTHRFKIINCNIIGFSSKGIVVNSKYYGSIRDCKITHCGVGIFLDGGISKEVTAIKITRNEIRLNSQGIILNRGFGNTVIDNTIESNIANYLPSETEQPITYLSRGKALLLVNSHENIIRDNYIENHYSNVLFYNSNNNQVNSNFLVAGALEGQQNQVIFDGSSNKDNLFYFNEMHSASGTDGLSSLMTIYNYNSVEGNVFYTFNLDAILAQNNIWNSGFIGIESKSPIIIEPKSNRIYKNKAVKMFTLS